jgi:5-guanidino-2-oxopentanoate decarboxylase
VSELATAAEERLPLPIIVWNNDALKAIADGMDERHIPRIGVEPRSPDFVRLAQSLGCHATRAASREHLTESVHDALVAERPTLIELREDSPWLRS